MAEHDLDALGRLLYERLATDAVARELASARARARTTAAGDTVDRILRDL